MEAITQNINTPIDIKIKTTQNINAPSNIKAKHS